MAHASIQGTDCMGRTYSIFFSLWCHSTITSSNVSTAPPICLLAWSCCLSLSPKISKSFFGIWLLQKKKSAIHFYKNNSNLDHNFFHSGGSTFYKNSAGIIFQSIAQWMKRLSSTPIKMNVECCCTIVYRVTVQIFFRTTSLISVSSDILLHLLLNPQVKL